MDENRITLSTRYAPPIDEVAGQLKEKLSGINNPGELQSEVHRKIGQHNLVLLTFLRPHVLTKGHSVLTVLLTEEADVITAELICVHTSAYYSGNIGNRSFGREAECVLRELGFTGEHDAEPETETGLLSALKRLWNTDEGSGRPKSRDEGL